MKRIFTVAAISVAVLISTTAPGATGVGMDETTGVTTLVTATQADLARYQRHVHWYRHKIDALNTKIVELQPEPTPIAAPAPTSTTSYPSGVLSAQEVGSFARGAGFPESVIPTMVAIAYRESRFNPAAVNSSSGACGLWQIYPCPGPDALDPARNAALAYSKYQSGGLSPWSL